MTHQLTHQLTRPPAQHPASRGRRLAVATARVLAVIAAVLVARIAVGGLLGTLGVPDLVTGVLTAAAVLGAYVGVTRAVEKRRSAELAPAGAGRELLLGGTVGVGLVGAVVGLLAVFGMYSVDGTNPFSTLGVALGSAVAAGVVEELLVRGVVFRLLELRFGTWAAVGVSSALFGALHLVNPGATVVSALAIALEAGVLLGLAYTATRRLWVPIGLHIAWNATESGLFGVPTSGEQIDGVLRAHLSGPSLLSGGAFGIEGSALTVVVCLVAAAFFHRAAKRTGRLVPGRRQQLARR